MGNENTKGGLSFLLLKAFGAFSDRTQQAARSRWDFNQALFSYRDQTIRRSDRQPFYSHAVCVRVRPSQGPASLPPPRFNTSYEPPTRLNINASPIRANPLIREIR